MLVFLALLLVVASTAVAGEGNKPLDADIPDAGWVDIYFATFDGVVASAGMVPLRYKRLPGRLNEVRVWVGGGPGYPQSLVRLIINGQHVQGEMIWHWPVRWASPYEDGKDFHDLMLYSLAGRCTEFRLAEKTGTCRVILDPEPDWAEVLHAAEQSGLWTLPDPSDLDDNRPPALDGWGIVVEWSDGDRYRTYHYNNPDLYPDWPEARRAVEIAAPFQALHDRIPPPDIEGNFRGIMDLDRPELRPCDGGSPWMVRYGMSPLLEASELPLPESDAESYLVELRAEPVADWLVKRRDYPYARALQRIRLLSIRPADGSRCTAR